jgi:hypothetical protein
VKATKQGTTLFTALLILVGTAVVVQLWLVTAAMEALLAHDYHVLAPLALGSLVLFGLNASLLKFLYDFDRRLTGILDKH